MSIKAVVFYTGTVVVAYDCLILFFNSRLALPIALLAGILTLFSRIELLKVASNSIRQFEIKNALKVLMCFGLSFSGIAMYGYAFEPYYPEESIANDTRFTLCAFIINSFAVPVLEELFWREYLLNGLRWGVEYAFYIIACALLFSLYHMAFGDSIIRQPLIFSIGLLQSFIYLRYGLGYAVFNHISTNTLAGIICLYFEGIE